MKAVETRRQGQGPVMIILRNDLKSELFAEFVLPVIHAKNTDQFCTGQASVALQSRQN
jgi:hypothetical protein